MQVHNASYHHDACKLTKMHNLHLATEKESDSNQRSSLRGIVAHLRFLDDPPTTTGIDNVAIELQLFLSKYRSLNASTTTASTALRAVLMPTHRHSYVTTHS